MKQHTSTLLLAPLLAALLAGCGATAKNEPARAEANAPAERVETVAAAPAPALDTPPPAATAPAATAPAVTEGVTVEAGVIYVKSDIPFKDSDEIVSKVKEECTELGSQFADSILKFGNKQKLKIKLVDELPSQGTVVSITINSVISEGNANPFNPHRKQVFATATLLQDGNEAGSNTFSRFSGGGFWGGFKGSCSVLQHTVNTLGNDVAKWLKKSAKA